MIRSDIQIFHKQNSIVIQSDRNFFAFSKNSAGMIRAFCNVNFSVDALADITQSGIVSIISCDKGNMVFSSKFGYDVSKMEDVIISIFEKYDL
jgi:hypothetical protein